MVKEHAFAKGTVLKPSSGQFKPQGNQTERQWSSGSLVVCEIPGLHVACQLHVDDRGRKGTCDIDIGTEKLF